MGKNLENLKVLIAGCGSIGRWHARILALLGVKDIMAFDNNQGQVELLIKEQPNVRLVSTFETGLEEADAAFILTWYLDHTSVKPHFCRSPKAHRR